MAAIPTTMRAVQWTTTKGGIEKNLSVNPTAPLPKQASSLPEGHTLVKVAYTTVNPVDHKFPDHLPFLFSKPSIPCLDFSGIVHSTANSLFKPGDRICGRTSPLTNGALADYLVVVSKSCIPVPAAIDLKTAACLGTVGLTAYQSLEPYIKTGSRVLINGASGGTGTFGIQIARALGAVHVTAVCSGANAEFCKSLGADKVVDYKTEDVVATLRATGMMYDHVVDNNSLKLFDSCEAFLKPDGTYLTIAASPSLAVLLDVAKAMLLPAFLGGVRRPFKMLATTDDVQALTKIAHWVAGGTVKVIVGDELDMSEAGSAFAKFKAGGTRGKMVIKVGGE